MIFSPIGAKPDTLTSYRQPITKIASASKPRMAATAANRDNKPLSSKSGPKIKPQRYAGTHYGRRCAGSGIDGMVQAEHRRL
jgi:hypothetical protein